MNNYEKLEQALLDHVRREETLFNRGKKSDSLCNHILRVASYAEKIGKTEGLDPTVCRLAGLAHDAGKFTFGRYHECNQIEEENSAAVFQELAKSSKIAQESIDEIADAIVQLYSDVEYRTPLARVLYDADNLDKLGHLGIVNFFIKAGLRGSGLSEELLLSQMVELTYARHSSQRMKTAAGRELAEKRAAYTTEFIHEFIELLKEDGIFNLQIIQDQFDGLTIDLVIPISCKCGGNWKHLFWNEDGIKCREIHVKYECTQCGRSSHFKFCHPLTASANQ